ncbi:MAG: RHS repeat-associated core domain-containing protein, partial [Terriglobales bacterium]
SLPYGADLNCTGGTDYSPMHFTGQVRDAATGLDHFPARNYTSAWGRWMTPDWSASPAAVPYATFSDPQSLDLYAYALDNPVTNTDPSGHWCFIGVGTTCAPKKVKGGPKLAGPDWMTRCWGNSLCAKAILAGLVAAAVTENQMRRQVGSLRKHPWLNGGLVVASAFVGPEAEEGGDAIEEAEEAEAAAPGGAGTGATQSTGTAEITFGHGARHLEGTGLEAERVESAIAESVNAASANSTGTGSFWGKVNVDGTTILYKAFTLPGGKINVGTYFPVEE